MPVARAEKASKPGGVGFGKKQQQQQKQQPPPKGAADAPADAPAAAVEDSVNVLPTVRS